MFRNPAPTNVDMPLKIILVSKDESAERVLFMYPFDTDILLTGLLRTNLTKICLESNKDEMMGNEFDTAILSGEDEQNEKLS